MEAGVPLAVSDLAAALDRPADGLYHHIRRLLETGIVVEAGVRATPRHPETLYRLAAPRLRFDTHAGDGAAPDGPLGLMRTVVKAGERSMAAAMRSGMVRFDEPGRNACVRFDAAHLSAEEAARVVSLVGEVQRVLDEARRRQWSSAAGEDAAGGPAASGADGPAEAESTRLYGLTVLFGPAASDTRPGPVSACQANSNGRAGDR